MFAFKNRLETPAGADRSIPGVIGSAASFISRLMLSNTPKMSAGLASIGTRSMSHGITPRAPFIDRRSQNYQPCVTHMKMADTSNCSKFILFVGAARDDLQRAIG